MSGRGIIHWSGHGKLLTDRQISFVSDQKVLSDVLRGWWQKIWFRV